MKPVAIIAFGALLGGGCVSSHEGTAQPATRLSRASEWEGIYANAANLPQTNLFSSYLQLSRTEVRPREVDAIRVTVSEGVVHFFALQAGLVVGQREIPLNEDFSQIVLQQKSDGGKIGHAIPGAGSINSETVLFKNAAGNIVAHERTRGAVAAFYVLPVGFRDDVYAEFKRKSLSPEPNVR